MFHMSWTMAFVFGVSPTTKKNHLEQKELLSLLVNRIKNVAIFTLSTEGVIMDWNPAARRLFGYPGKDVVGKSISFLFPRLKNANKLHEDLQSALDVGQYTHETTIQTKEGKVLWVNCIVTALWDKNKKLQGFSKVVEDITDRKEKDTKRSEYVSLIGHELKNPLTSIKSYLQILQIQMRKNQQLHLHQFVEKALSQVDTLASLIEDLVDTTKIDIGILKYEDKDTIVVNVFLKKIVELFQPTIQHKIVIRGNVKKIIKADKIRLEQVMNNLLINAAKYSPKGNTIIIHVAQTEDDILIGVEDFGIGISEEDREKIFDKFHRLPEAKQLTTGLGLGLYLASQIIFHYGGRLWVEGTKGKGSIFYFTFPLKQKVKL